MADIFETTDAAAGTNTAFNVGVGQVVMGQLGTGEHDWYRVTLTAGQTYTFALRGTGNNGLEDPTLTLRNSAGTQVAFNDDIVLNINRDSLLTFTATTSGTYYLDAGSYNNSYSGQYGLSVAQGLRPHYDQIMAETHINVDRSWSAAPGTGVTVTYGFRSTAPTYSDPYHPLIESTFAQLTPTQITAVRAALQMWSDVAGIRFSEVSPASATLLFANYTDANDPAGAFVADFPSPGYLTPGTADDGDVFFNTIPNGVSTSSLPFGSYSFSTVLHEIGHAIGLSHPGAYDAGAGNPTYATDAEFIEDSLQYSVMSYFQESNTGANFGTVGGGYNDTPMLYDIYTLQRIYGANMSTRTGDTVYGFGSTAGSVYDFTTNTTPALCIWDAGGIDMLNCSGFSQSQIINLNAGTFSNIGGLTLNVSIAYGATIENAQGGSGVDIVHGNGANNTIYGNGGADQLHGNGGDDTLVGGAARDYIDGGSGFDTAVLSSNYVQYRTLGFGGSVVVGSASDGAEMLANVARVQFADYITTVFPSALNYIASHGDLINILGVNGQGGLNHFWNYGYAEGRQATFDGLDYIASYNDLMNLFGANDQSGTTHFIQYGFREGRKTTFNGIEYVASYGDLMNLYGANDDGGAAHFMQYGRFEGRKTTFNGLEYVASHGDLMNILGANEDGGAAHYIQFGRFEGRKTTFNGLEYIASYSDLSNLLGINDDAGARHYIQYGRFEGRQTTFDGLKYIASYGDLINLFHVNEDAGAGHFIQYGRFEGRSMLFNPVSYLANYGDLQALFGNNQEAATMHFINYGYAEGRHW